MIQYDRVPSDTQSKFGDSLSRKRKMICYGCVCSTLLIWAIVATISYSRETTWDCTGICGTTNLLCEACGIFDSSCRELLSEPDKHLFECGRHGCEFAENYWRLSYDVSGFNTNCSFLLASRVTEITHTKYPKISITGIILIAIFTVILILSGLLFISALKKSRY